MHIVNIQIHLCLHWQAQCTNPYLMGYIVKDRYIRE